LKFSNVIRTMCLKPFISWEPLPFSWPLPVARARFSGPDDHAAQGQVRTGRPTQFRTRAGARTAPTAAFAGRQSHHTDRLPTRGGDHQALRRTRNRIRSSGTTTPTRKRSPSRRLTMTGGRTANTAWSATIIFTPDSKRFEKVKFAPPDTLRRISLSQQDLDDVRNVAFVLTTTELPKYNVDLRGAAAGGRAFDVRV